MRLRTVVKELDRFDQEAGIYAAEPWTENSKSMILREPDSGELPEEAIELDLKYFIEIIIANDFLEDWAANLDKPPTIQEKCARLIRYAIDDA